MHEVLVNRLGGLSLPRKSVVRLTDRPDMTLDVYRGRKTTIQHQYNNTGLLSVTALDNIQDLSAKLYSEIKNVFDLDALKGICNQTLYLHNSVL